MTDAPAPLTPADCDLSDFDRMPLDIKRLGGSKFDAGLDDSAWRAGLNLWMSAWHARPAGSLDDDEEALCTAAGLRDLKKWAKVKAKAMREHWVRCSDGRIYHKTLSELALESWLEKLGQRKSSGAGNAKRWGSKFDPEQVQLDIDVACEHLERLNPDSKALAKARRKHGKRNPDGNENPGGSQSQRDKTPRGELSQENGEERNGEESKSPSPLPDPEPASGATAAGGPAALPTLTQAEWFSRVDGLIAILPGINRTTGGLANIAPLRSTLSQRTQTKNPATGCSTSCRRRAQPMLSAPLQATAFAAGRIPSSPKPPALTETHALTEENMIDPPNPAQADQHLLQSLEHSCGVRISQVGKQVIAKAAKATLNIPLAQKLTTKALAPYSDEAVLRALARLEGMTGKPKPKDDESEDLTIDGMLAKIRRYPGDIVMHVLWSWDDRHQFWPRWAQLRAELDEVSALRRGILPALMDVKREEEKRPPPSQEEIDAVNAIHARFLAKMGASQQPKHKKTIGMLEQRVIDREAAEREQVLRDLHPDVEA